MLLEQIQTDLAIALKAKNPAVVSILRFLLAEIHNREIQKQAKLTDEDVVGVIRQQNRQQRESIEAYQKGGRDDLVAKEKEELEILSKYLPQQRSNQPNRGDRSGRFWQGDGNGDGKS